MKLKLQLELTLNMNCIKPQSKLKLKLKLSQKSLKVLDQVEQKFWQLERENLPIERKKFLE